MAVSAVENVGSFKMISSQTNPGDAKRYAHRGRVAWWHEDPSGGTDAFHIYARPCVVTMVQAIWHKFAHDARFKRMLLDTGTSLMIENTVGDPADKFRDSFWGSATKRGVGDPADGINMLGNVLMFVRDMIRLDEECFPGRSLPQDAPLLHPHDWIIFTQTQQYDIRKTCVMLYYPQRSIDAALKDNYAGPHNPKTVGMALGHICDPYLASARHPFHTMG